MLNEILSILAIVVVNFVLNSILIQEYKNNFTILQKRWARISFLVVGWVFMGIVIISTMVLILFWKTLEGVKLAIKK